MRMPPVSEMLAGPGGCPTATASCRDFETMSIGAARGSHRCAPTWHSRSSGRALAHGLAELLGVVDELAPDDPAVTDLQHLRGGQGPLDRCHGPVDHRAHQVAVGELVADTEARDG